MSQRRDHIALPLDGTPCAVCALPAAFLTTGGRVFHTYDTGKPPCLTRPVPTWTAHTPHEVTR